MLSNYPATRREDVADAMIEMVIPALAEAIDNAAADLAGELFGDQLTAFDVERLSNDMLYALADLLVLAPIPGRGVHDMLRIHQLQNVAYAADYYGVKLHDVDDGESYTIDQLFADEPLHAGVNDTLSPAAPVKPYEPAIVTPPAAPAIVVDNRPKPLRTLEQIKAEVDARAKRATPTLQFTPYDHKQEERRVVIERARLEQERKDNERIEAGIKRESSLDAKDERDLLPLGQLPLPPLKPDTSIPKQRERMCDNERCRKKFKPRSSQQRYCCDSCRTMTWHRQFGRKRSK